jgi:Tfp pilus assembly protein PilN
VIEPVPELPLPDAVDDVAAFQRVFELEDRIRAQLVDERIDIWRPEGKRVLVTGTARSNTATSDFLRMLGRDAEVERAELVSISVEGERTRFSIFVDLRAP